MMFVGLFYLLLLSGGSMLEQQHLDGQPESAEKNGNMSGGSMLEQQHLEGQLESAKKNGNMSVFRNQSVMESQVPEFNFRISETVRETQGKNKENCSFEDISNYLNLSKNSTRFTISRPVKHYSHPTLILLEMKIYAILNVREIDQIFISYIWIYLSWKNEYIQWDPDEFCGTKHILVPTNLMWMPDLTIEEMTEHDKSSPSPYLNIKSDGWMEFRNDKVVVSSCKIQVYNFPFDIQSCNISFKSIMHSAKEISLWYNENNTVITEESRKAMQTQFEWLFLNMTVTQKTVNHFGFSQTVIVYTINMKRRSVLYIANFMLPVLFFLCLDFASLLMSDTGGEKVGFKITILLAVTVMQLILNEILPCSSDRIPLIAIYCIGIFTFMLLSLVETILVIHLRNKDASQENETDGNESQNEGQNNKQKYFHRFLRIKNQSSTGFANDTLDEALYADKEGYTTHHDEVSLALEKLSIEVGDIKKSITLIVSTNEYAKNGYWTKLANKINKYFSIFYITSVFLFLLTIFIMWHSAEES